MEHYISTQSAVKKNLAVQAHHQDKPPCIVLCSHSVGHISKWLSMQTFNSTFDSVQIHLIILDLCVQERVGVMKISGSKSILMSHRLCGFGG